MSHFRMIMNTLLLFCICLILCNSALFSQGCNHGTTQDSHYPPGFIISQCDEEPYPAISSEFYPYELSTIAWEPGNPYDTLRGKRCSFFFEIEGLWWTVCQDNLDYAVEFDPFDPDAILGPGETKFLKYDWCGGARGYVGFRKCGWDVGGRYTWYRNDSENELNLENSENEIKTTLLHPATEGEVAEKVGITSHVLYQTFAVFIGKDLCFWNQTILLHPFFGVKGLKICQELKVLYEGGDFVLFEPQSFIGDEEAAPPRVRWNSQLCAIGLTGGLDMYYRWYCGFGLYGSFCGSALTSRTDIRHRQETLSSDGNIASTEIDLIEKEGVCIPGCELTAGISWDFSYGGCFSCILKGGYDFSYWFNTPQLRRYHNGNNGVSSDSSGNIGFHGATLTASIIF
jgi:hypothetical protein